MNRDVTLQINLSPGDARMAETLLVHQLERLAPTVRTVMLTVDGMAGGGKFADNGTPEEALQHVLDAAVKRFENIDVREVRYDTQAIQAVSNRFFDGQPYGLKDRRGGPCHCYLDALLAVETRYVFHIDSDMIFGGDPATWIDEAISELDRHEVIVVNPLGGPPGDLDQYQSHKMPERIPAGFLFPKMSTRIFLTDVERFFDVLCPLPDPVRPRPSEVFERWIGGHPDQELPEALLSRSMKHAGVKRLDMSGSGEGLWVIHPVHKTDQFIAMLPDLLRAVDNNQIPAGQRGHYDLQPSFAPLTDLPGFRQKVRYWLNRTPRQPQSGGRRRP